MSITIGTAAVVALLADRTAIPPRAVPGRLLPRERACERVRDGAERRIAQSLAVDDAMRCGLRTGDAFARPDVRRIAA